MRSLVRTKFVCKSVLMVDRVFFYGDDNVTTTCACKAMRMIGHSEDDIVHYGLI